MREILPHEVTFGLPSKISMNTLVMATQIMSASKTGVTAHQLHRMLDITYVSAWLMAHPGAPISA